MCLPHVFLKAPNEMINAQLSPDTCLKNIRKRKRWNFAAQNMMKQGAQEHTQTLHLTAAKIKNKKITNKPNGSSRSMKRSLAVNRTYLESQNNIHK